MICGQDRDRDFARSARADVEADRVANRRARSVGTPCCARTPRMSAAAGGSRADRTNAGATRAALRAPARRSAPAKQRSRPTPRARRRRAPRDAREARRPREHASRRLADDVAQFVLGNDADDVVVERRAEAGERLGDRREADDDQAARRHVRLDVDVDGSFPAQPIGTTIASGRRRRIRRRRIRPDLQRAEAAACGSRERLAAHDVARTRAADEAFHPAVGEDRSRGRRGAN